MWPVRDFHNSPMDAGDAIDELTDRQAVALAQQLGGKPLPNSRPPCETPGCRRPSVYLIEVGNSAGAVKVERYCKRHGKAAHAFANRPRMAIPKGRR